MLHSKNKGFRDYVLLKVSRNKFLSQLGFQLNEIKEGFVAGELLVREDHEQQNGFVHGGVISTVADMVCGFAAYSLVAEGEQVFTVEIKVSYLRPGIADKIVGRGQVVKAGSNFHFCEGEVYAEKDGEQKLIAKATSTMAVLDRKVNDKYGG